MLAKAEIECDFPPLMIQQMTALRSYADKHGRLWKDHLRVEWLAATAPPMLHHLRNTHGPYWLHRFRLPH